MAQGATNHPERRLDSWKEIAAFFGRDERTVRRWEKGSGLPVHRVPGAAMGRVFAYESELELWLSTPQALRTTTLSLEPQASPVQPSRVQPEGKHRKFRATIPRIFRTTTTAFPSPTKLPTTSIPNRTLFIPCSLLKMIV